MSQYVTFTLGRALYGIDVLRTREALRPQERTPVPLAPRDVAGLVNLRGQIIMAIDLRTRLGLPRNDAEPMMVVVEAGSSSEDTGAVGLLVDEIGDVIEAGADTFEGPPRTLDPAVTELVVGAHKLPGRLLLVLDADAATAA